jgi:hypothetical protein
MSKEGDEMRIAGIIAAGAGLLMLVLLAFACGETPDYHPQPRPTAVTEGCAPPDAGPDAYECTVNPLAGTLTCP